ncbi:MAG: DUF1236 domain-containing protein, partial [Bradyrhizobium sp.]
FRSEPDAAPFVSNLPRGCGSGGTIMKKLLILVAVGSLAATIANAQTATVTTGAGNAAVQIEPQYRTKIKTYVTEHKIRPVESREKIVIGSRVPSDVELVAVPSDWGPSLTKYRYVYSGDRVMLVDPGTRTVVQEVD